MFLGRITTVTLVTVASLVGAAAPLRAQVSEAPSNAPVQVGPLALSPAIRVSDFGHDSNVFNRNVESNPVADVTATVSPAVDAWLRLPHARLNGRSQLDFHYFKQLADLRAIDTDSRVHADLLLNRLTPYIAGALANIRDRQNLEIDAIAKRRGETVTAGVSVRLTAKVSAEVHASRSSIQYEQNSSSLIPQTDLSRQLDHHSTGEGAALRWAMTPYTTFAVEMQQNKDRFASAVERNSDSVEVTPSVEFKPLALVSGKASVGIRTRKFLAGGVPDFKGTVALVDLNYTFREATRFAVSTRRALEYSSLVGFRDYLVMDVTGSVTQRFRESWDVGGSLGRARLSYRPETTPVSLPVVTIPDETVLTSAADAGYTLGHARIGFRVERRKRQGDVLALGRGYHRLRIGSTLSYVF